MKFGSSVLYIVLVPATDYCRYDDVEDIIEQYVMVHIVKCSCWIESDEHCSESRQQSWYWSSTVQCMSSVSEESHVEPVDCDMCQHFRQQDIF